MKCLTLAYVSCNCYLNSVPSWMIVPATKMCRHRVVMPGGIWSNFSRSTDPCILHMKKSTLERLYFLFWALLSRGWVYVPAMSIGKSSSFNDFSVANFGGLVTLKGNDEVNWMRFSLILATSDQTNGLSKLLSSCNHPVLIHMVTALALDNVSDLS